MRNIVLIAHDMRSCHNVGSLLRTSEGLGVSKVYLTGYTPYPIISGDTRLPHIARKLDKQIQKTALGAQNLIDWAYQHDITEVINILKVDGFSIVGLEQHKKSIELPKYQPVNKIAILLGREVEGVDDDLLSRCDVLLEIPMHGKKESFNVVQAAAMVLYYCTFFKS